MNTDFIKGVVVPILTPIDADERIDEAAFRRQIDYVIDGGMHGILVFGSNGEFYQIEEDEMERGLQIAVSQAAGTGLFRHRRHQHKKVRASCENGGQKRRGGGVHSPAHVPETHTG